MGAFRTALILSLDRVFMSVLLFLHVLLYGCKSWILSNTLTTSLEKLQSEIGRRILGLSNHHADLAPIIELHLPSIKACILIQKLTFLGRFLSSNGDELSARVLCTLSYATCRRTPHSWILLPFCLLSIVLHYLLSRRSFGMLTAVNGKHKLYPLDMCIHVFVNTVNNIIPCIQGVPCSRTGGLIILHEYYTPTYVRVGTWHRKLVRQLCLWQMVPSATCILL